jgi:hypothetical protein
MCVASVGAFDATSNAAEEEDGLEGGMEEKVGLEFTLPAAPLPPLAPLMPAAAVAADTSGDVTRGVLVLEDPGVAPEAVEAARARRGDSVRVLADADSPGC